MQDEHTSDFETAMAANRDREAERIATLRKDCRAQLQAIGITAVEAEYEGYADESNVRSLSFAPETIAPDDSLRNKVHDLMWELSWQTNPEYDVNDGATGEITWRLANDNVEICHRQHYIAERITRHENV